jgi:predicted nucleic acid-binding protein
MPAELVQAGAFDTLISASALGAQTALFTRNTYGFDRVPGLSREYVPADWASSVLQPIRRAEQAI